MNKIWSIARDPVWQMVGVFVAILLALPSMSSSTAGPQEVSIIHFKQERMIDQWLPADRLKLLFSGAEHELDRTAVDSYLVINESTRSIAPASFVDPLRVLPAADGIRVVTVSSCATQHAQTCSPDGRNSSVYVSTNWKQERAGWVAENPHLNPGDSACVVVVSEHPKLSQSKSAPLPRWSTRVADYKTRVFDSLDEYEASRSRSLISYAFVSISLHGAGVYWFFALLAALLFINLSLAKQSSWADLATSKGIILCIALIFACVSTSEILVDALVNRRRELHPAAWPLVILHTLFVLYLIAKVVRVRRASKNS